MAGVLAELTGAVVPLAGVDLFDRADYPQVCKTGGRLPYPLATMLRIHLLQQLHSLSDPAMEEDLIDVPTTMHRFAGIEQISDRIPDEMTLLAFLHLLEKHGLGEQILISSRCSWSDDMPRHNRGRHLDHRAHFHL
jgi:IS5 family transposase